MKMYQININAGHTFDLSNSEIRTALEIYLFPTTLKKGHFYRINLDLLKEIVNDKFIKQYPGRKKLLQEINAAEIKGLKQFTYYCSE